VFIIACEKLFIENINRRRSKVVGFNFIIGLLFFF
jgi:hypothetical protein